MGSKSVASFVFIPSSFFYLFFYWETLKKVCACLLALYTQDTACSTEALGHLQGTILYSSTSGEGMRLEYPLFLFDLIATQPFSIHAVPFVFYLKIYFGLFVLLN